MTPRGMRVLGALVAAATPMRRCELAAATGASKATATRIVKRLLALDLAREVARETPEDVRGARLVVTDAGRDAWEARDAQPVITLAAVESTPEGLTPREWQVLAAVAQLGTVAPGALARLLGVTREAVTHHVRRLAAAGLLERRGRTSALRVELTDLGRARLEAAPSPEPLLPPELVDCELPVHVGLTRSALEVLRFIVTEARRDRVPAYKDVASHCAVTIAGIFTIIETLERGGLVVRRRSLRVTALGLAVADGRVPVVSPQRVRSDRIMRAPPAPKPRAPRPRTEQRRDALPSPPAAQPQAPTPKDAAAPPLRVPALSARETRTPELAPPKLPALSSSLSTLRGIRHPPMPLAHAAPSGMRESTWDAITTIKSQFAPRYA